MRRVGQALKRWQFVTRIRKSLKCLLCIVRSLKCWLSGTTHYFFVISLQRLRNIFQHSKEQWHAPLFSSQPQLCCVDNAPKIDMGKLGVRPKKITQSFPFCSGFLRVSFILFFKQTKLITHTLTLTPTLALALTHPHPHPHSLWRKHLKWHRW